jgi:hypothetical protein
LENGVNDTRTRMSKTVTINADFIP